MISYAWIFLILFGIYWVCNIVYEKCEKHIDRHGNASGQLYVTVALWAAGWKILLSILCWIGGLALIILNGTLVWWEWIGLLLLGWVPWFWVYDAYTDWCYTNRLIKKHDFEFDAEPDSRPESKSKPKT